MNEAVEALSESLYKKIEDEVAARPEERLSAETLERLQEFYREHGDLRGGRSRLIRACKCGKKECKTFRKQRQAGHKMRKMKRLARPRKSLGTVRREMLDAVEGSGVESFYYRMVYIMPFVERDGTMQEF